MNEKLSRYVGAEFAKLLIKLWDSLSNDTKKGIKKKIDVHHGEIGVLTTLLGYILSSLSEKEKGEFLKGFGETLMIDDIQDIGKWFKPRNKQP